MLIDTIVPQLSDLITIHSAIIDCGLWSEVNHKGQLKGHSSIQLWYLCRGLDTCGSGTVILNLRETARLLKISCASVRRRLKLGIELEFFRFFEAINDGNYKIYYSSLENVCLRHNITDLGAITEISLGELKHLKFRATEAEALRLQNQSRYKEVKRNPKKDSQRRTINPETLTSSELGNGAILAKMGRLTLLKRSASPYGGSQKRIAWNMGRHPSTIQRRLSDGYRELHQLDPILKTQLAAAPKIFEQFVSASRPPIRRVLPGQNIIFVPGLGKFRICCNVYVIDLELKRNSSQRARIKRAFKRAEDRELVSNDWKLQPEYLAYKASLREQNDKFQLSQKKMRPPEDPSNSHKEGLSVENYFSNEDTLKDTGRVKNMK